MRDVGPESVFSVAFHSISTESFFFDSVLKKSNDVLCRVGVVTTRRHLFVCFRALSIATQSTSLEKEVWKRSFTNREQQTTFDDPITAMYHLQVQLAHHTPCHYHATRPTSQFNDAAERGVSSSLPYTYNGGNAASSSL